MENLKEFLEELTQLSKKYKIFVSGCGCCGSPYLVRTTEFVGRYTVYDEEYGPITLIYQGLEE